MPPSTCLTFYFLESQRCSVYGNLLTTPGPPFLIKFSSPNFELIWCTILEYTCTNISCIVGSWVGRCCTHPLSNHLRCRGRNLQRVQSSVRRRRIEPEVYYREEQGKCCTGAHTNICWWAKLQATVCLLTPSHTPSLVAKRRAQIMCAEMCARTFGVVMLFKHVCFNRCVGVGVGEWVPRFREGQ